MQPPTAPQAPSLGTTAHGTLALTVASAETLCVHLAGQWTIQAVLPDATDLHRRCATPVVRRLMFEASGLERWDSALLTFLLAVQATCAAQQVVCDQTGLPHGVQRLLTLATAVPERQDTRRSSARRGPLVWLGQRALAVSASAHAFLVFVGEVTLALGQFLRGRARFRRVDLWLIIQECGVQALPIVSLISLLVGMILAFVGATQLRQFGAQIYVANMIGLGMAREMGAMMTGIIMAGRTGAAFAAQLGTMTVNEEIDALTTMGLKPIEFLVLPRMLALALMMPLLCLYADLVGILGGAVIGIGMLNLGTEQYFRQMLISLHLNDFLVGLIKGAVFGVLVALAGCLRGMQCGRSAAAVGTAATSAVVTGIVWIIVSDAFLTILYDILGV